MKTDVDGYSYERNKYNKSRKTDEEVSNEWKTFVIERLKYPLIKIIPYDIIGIINTVIFKIEL